MPDGSGGMSSITAPSISIGGARSSSKGGGSVLSIGSYRGLRIAQHAISGGNKAYNLFGPFVDGEIIEAITWVASGGAAGAQVFLELFTHAVSVPLTDAAFRAGRNLIANYATGGLTLMCPANTSLSNIIPIGLVCGSEDRFVSTRFESTGTGNGWVGLLLRGGNGDK